MARRVDPEIRAAEIVALIRTKYPHGGWFACMTRDERIGWNMHDDESWYGKEAEFTNTGCTPINARMWAGWLARETISTRDRRTIPGDPILDGPRERLHLAVGNDLTLSHVGALSSDALHDVLGDRVDRKPDPTGDDFGLFQIV